LTAKEAKTSMHLRLLKCFQFKRTLSKRGKLAQDNFITCLP